MDRTNCPSGMASDHVFLYESDFVPNSCGASIALFSTVLGVMSVFRLGVALLQFKVWRAREEQIQARTGKKRKRAPIFPIFSLIQALALCLFTVLASLNVANASNGATGALLGLFYTPLCIGGIFMCARLIKLGRRLIPLSKKIIMSDSNSPTGSGDSSLAYLGQTDGILRVMFAVCGLATILCPTAFVIAGLIKPVYATFQAGAASFFAQDLLLVSGICYQYERLRKAVQSTEYPKEVVSNDSRDKIKLVLWRMRAQQAVWAVCGGTASIIWILNITRAVLPFYWFSFLHFGVEVVFTTISTLSMASRVGSRAGKSSAKSSNNNNDNNTAEISNRNNHSRVAGGTPRLMARSPVTAVQTTNVSGIISVQKDDYNDKSSLVSHEVEAYNPNFDEQANQ